MRLNELQAMDAAEITLDALKAAGVVPVLTLRAKVILSGKIERSVKLMGADLLATKGAKAAIEAAGGSVAAAE